MTYEQWDLLKIAANVLVVSVAVPLVMYFWKRSLRKRDTINDQNVKLHRKILDDKSAEVDESIASLDKRFEDMKGKNDTSHKELWKEINLARERIAVVEVKCEDK